MNTPGIPRLPALKALTSIRFFAAYYVALYHFVRPFSLWGVLAPLMSCGYLAVSFFFVLSGFILTYSHAREYEEGKGNAAKFYVARLARIYPVYCVSMLVAAYVERGEFVKKIHFVAYLADLLMIQAWSIRAASVFNPPAWSLAAEAFFYLLFPFVFMRLRPSNPRNATLAIGALWIVALLIPLVSLKLYPVASWKEDLTYAAHGINRVNQIRKLPILALPQFLAGISAGWLYLRFRPSPKVAASLAWIGLAILTVSLLLADHIPFLVMHNGLFIPLFAMIILGLAESNWLSRVLSHPALVLLGEASFCLYLFHFLFNDWVKSSFAAPDTILAALWKSAVIIPISILLHLTVERPGRRLILRWWGRKHSDELRPVLP